MHPPVQGWPSLGCSCSSLAERSSCSLVYREGRSCLQSYMPSKVLQHWEAVFPRNQSSALSFQRFHCLTWLARLKCSQWSPAMYNTLAMYIYLIACNSQKKSCTLANHLLTECFADLHRAATAFPGVQDSRIFEAHNSNSGHELCIRAGL